MSADAISTVSKALRDHLADGGVGATVVIADPIKAQTGEISLWLYQVAVDEFSRNRTPQAVDVGGKTARLKMPPLGVNLTYLLTPMVDDQEMAQSLLGKIMLSLHEAPQFAVAQTGAQVNEFVRLSFVPETLDERVKLWESLAKPYRLSVSYQARTVRLQPATISSDAPIVVAQAAVEDKPVERRAD